MKNRNPKVFVPPSARSWGPRTGVSAAMRGFVPDGRHLSTMRDCSPATYGTATAFAVCGCRQTRLLAPEQDIWIEWTRCSKHYEPERDDALILAAAANRRELHLLNPGRRAEAWSLLRAPARRKKRKR